MTKDRNPSEAILGILTVVPEEEADFRKTLESIEVSSRYTAPERMNVVWIEIGNAFFDRFGPSPPNDGWGKQAVDILMRKA